MVTVLGRLVWNVVFSFYYSVDKLMNGLPKAL